MKPKIIICGQKARQAPQFEALFADRARLSFFHDGNLHQLQQRARHATAVFVCIDACAHRTILALRAAGCVPRYVNGAAESLKAAIETFLQGRP